MNKKIPTGIIIIGYGIILTSLLIYTQVIEFFLNLKKYTLVEQGIIVKNTFSLLKSYPHELVNPLALAPLIYGLICGTAILKLKKWAPYLFRIPILFLTAIISFVLILNLIDNFKWIMFLSLIVFWILVISISKYLSKYF